ncbi:MAG: hypothetical protein EOO34_00725 [Cyanobacteriota bacterium]|nr:MAG: hypothetical protein EOO34_00725 [Cyanobacteriota bacterium]
MSITKHVELPNISNISFGLTKTKFLSVKDVNLFFQPYSFFVNRALCNAIRFLQNRSLLVNKNYSKNIDS